MLLINLLYFRNTLF